MFGRKAKRPAALGSLRNEENVQIIHSMGNTHKNIGEEEEEEEEGARFIVDRPMASLLLLLT